MEGAALTRPAVWAEWLVTILTPPAAREAVLGDLYETCHAPDHYLREASRTVPFVILSQMRRRANLPALGLQAFLIFFCLGGFGGAGPFSGMQAVIPTALILLALLLRDTYQSIHRQADRHAMGEAIIMVITMLGCSLLLTYNMSFVANFREDDLRWLRFGFMAPFLFPLLCLFRTGLIVEGDRRDMFADGLSEDAVLMDYRRFARRVRWQGRLEGAGLAAAAALVLTFREALHLPDPMLLSVLLSLYALSALYISVDGGVRPLPPRQDFLSLRALYQQEMTRQQHLRRFLLWLWCAPLLLALHGELIATGFAVHRPILVVAGTVAALVLCFCIGALNREHGGRVREKADLLDRVPQTQG
jgi:hypothetical protein